MKIAIDMDNTLIDELGSTLRPEIIEFLNKIFQKNILYVWTNSTKARAWDILTYHNIRKYFQGIIAREDYDPYEKGICKDMRLFNFDIIIDDDPEEIAFNKKNKQCAILVESYRKNKTMKKDELENIIKKYKLI